jgi:dihydrolipoamide dehydrogenase
MVVGDITTGTELLVVGGGPGGYVAAIRAAQRGLDVTLVERDHVGGVCLNHGCIPSKAYISAADLAHAAGSAEAMGVHANPAVDLAGVREWKDGVVDRLTGGVERLLSAAGVTVIEGTARFSDDHAVRIAHAEEGRGSETVEFEHCVVATGSRPVELGALPFSADPVISSREALALGTVPDRLLVVGGGYVGMELSTTFAKLGAEVAVVEMEAQVLPGYEADVARVVRRRAESLGVDVHPGERVTDWRDGTDGGVVVETVAAGEADGGGSGEQSYATDVVLVAAGREPVTDTLALEAAGLSPEPGGHLATDDHCRTAREHVYAVGDVSGEPMLAHVAMREGVVAAEHAAGEPAAFDNVAVPAAVFTDPEVATVGLTADEAREQGFDVAVGRVPFGANGRALTLDRTEGFVRVVADESAGFVLGGQVVGPEASELVAELALAIELGATVEDVAATVHTHPTLAEAVAEAAAAVRGQAIHARNRPRPSEGGESGR